MTFKILFCCIRSTSVLKNSLHLNFTIMIKKHLKKIKFREKSISPIWQFWNWYYIVGKRQGWYLLILRQLYSTDKIWLQYTWHVFKICSSSIIRLALNESILHSVNTVASFLGLNLCWVCTLQCTTPINNTKSRPIVQNWS